MKNRSGLLVSILLTVSVLAGTVFAGCAQGTDYTKEIKEYQEKLESLQSENAQLKQELGIVEESSETAAEPEETENVPEESVTEVGSSAEKEGTEAAESAENANTAESEQTTQLQEPEKVYPEPKIQSLSGVLEEGDVTNILVFGDSIWANDRDASGIAAKVEDYLYKMGYEVKIYNAAVGGTRASIDFDDNEWEYGPQSDNTLGKMLSILSGNTDIELINDQPAYSVMQEVMPITEEIDVVILAYGMNDFLSQAEKNCSERHWCGYGTALREGITASNRLCPNADVMLIAPTFASYFPIGVQNMGDKALFNYVRVANDVAREYHVLSADPYNNMGVDVYNADDYILDGIHLNELGRDLYARMVAGVLIYGKKGEISGNALPWEAFEE